MPIYEYECADCGQRIERLQRMDDPAPAACEACGGAMRRQISAPAFQFKGSGWYVTDYARKGSGDSGDSGDSGEPSEGKKEAASDGGNGKDSSTGSGSGREESKPAAGAGKTESKSTAKAAEAGD